MPIFGEYETVGEPHAITHARDYVATVWRARKSVDGKDRQYALKCIAPRRRLPVPDKDLGDSLDSDRSLEFVEVVKQIKKAQNEGGRGLAPIHAFGMASEGAWFVSDFYERYSLKALVNRQGQVDDGALRHVVYSVVTGCLALKSSCSRSHGNLKLSNVLRGGRTQPLRKTALMLMDPMPLPSATIAQPANPDQKAVGGMVHDVFEVQDIKAIGELILQLVEGRVIENGFDYNYPIAPSAAWGRLGKEGESWRNLCNRLLDPELSLDQINLSWLEKQFKPKSTGRYLAVFGGALLVAGLAGGGVYAFRLKAESVFKQHLDAARLAYQAGDSLVAIREIRIAQKKHPDDQTVHELVQNINTLIQRQTKDRKYQDAMKQGRKELASGPGHYAEAIRQAEVARSKAMGDEELKAAKQLEADARQAEQAQLVAGENEKAYQAAMKQGRTELASGPGRYTEAIRQAEVARSKAMGDEELKAAKQLEADAHQAEQAQLAAEENEKAYQMAMKVGRQAVVAKSFDEAITQANLALKLKPNDPDALSLLEQANKGKATAQYDDLIQLARSKRIDDPFQALTYLDKAGKMQKLDPDILKLADEIKTLRELDKQLEDFMKEYGVSPKVEIRAINPNRSAQHAYSSNQKSDSSLNDNVAINALKAKYKAGWLNAERTADFKLTQEKINLSGY
jgi:hypothetical protein